MSMPKQIDWTPVCSRGSTFQELKLVEVSNLRIEFRPTGYIKVVCWVFMAIALGCFALGAFVAPRSLVGMAVAVVAGFVFGGTGWVMLKVVGRPRVFDKRLGWYWKGSDSCIRTDLEQRNDAVELKRIHTVQILAKLVEFTGGESPSNTIETNYEINLVVDDGSRINVAAGGGDGHMYASYANSVGAFLNVSVLDGRYSRMSSQVF